MNQERKMLFIILNYLLPISITAVAIYFVSSNLFYLKKELRNHVKETECKNAKSEKDIDDIKSQIKDIPKHDEIKSLMQKFEENNHQLELTLKELPEKLKKHAANNAKVVENNLELFLQIWFEKNASSKFKDKI